MITIKGYDYDQVLDLQVDLMDKMEGCFVRSKTASTMMYVAWSDKPFTEDDFLEAYEKEFERPFEEDEE